MNLSKAIRTLERQALKAEKLAKAEQAKADSLHEKLESIQKLIGVLGGKTVKVTKKVPKVRRGRGKMSAAGRARIAAAQKKRWAAWKAKKGKKAVKVAPKAKRKLSAEGRARIVAAQKARWAKVKAAKEQK